MKTLDACLISTEPTTLGARRPPAGSGWFIDELVIELVRQSQELAAMLARAAGEPAPDPRLAKPAADDEFFFRCSDLADDLADYVRRLQESVGGRCLGLRVPPADGTQFLVDGLERQARQLNAMLKLVSQPDANPLRNVEPETAEDYLEHCADCAQAVAVHIRHVLLTPGLQLVGVASGRWQSDF